MGEYRIVKKTNGLGVVRWVVQVRSDFCWGDLTDMKRSLASARRAMEKLERRNRATTWSTEKVD